MMLDSVLKFHDKFGIRRGTSKNTCINLKEDEIRFRLNFLFEELFETAIAFGLEIRPEIIESIKAIIRNSVISVDKYDELEVIDGLLDLVYVALGTLDLKELSEEQIRQHWNAIQIANMSKERSTNNDSRSKRKHSLDIVKPAGWTGPNHKDIMDNNRIYNGDVDET